MRCKNTPKSYPTNRVFSTAQPGLSDEFMRGVELKESIHRCSDEGVLRKYKSTSKAPPLVSYRDLEKDEYHYNFPVGYNEIPDFITDPNCKGFGKKSNRLSLDECDLIIREELARKRHTIQRLFEDSAVNSQNGVSRKALLEIFKSLCPLMDIDMFHRLIERYQLNEEPLITFRKFEESFTAPPLGRRPPPVIFHGLGAERCVSVAQAYKMLREIACDDRFDLKTVLPPSCFEPEGRVLCPQLREALRLMRIHLTDENYRRLWRDKFDLGHFGSIRTSDLCKILNLKEDGTPLGLKLDVVPLTTASMKGVPKLDRNPQLWTRSAWPKFEMLPPEDNRMGGHTLVRELPTAGGASFPLTEQPTWEAKGPGGANEPEFGCGDRLKKSLENLETHHPKFEDIMDCLRYKFESPYQAMLVAFKRFDPANLNRVSENECLAILREYGISMDSDGLNAFLRRVLTSTEATGYGVGNEKPQPFDPQDERVVIKPGSVPYKRMLKNYQHRTTTSRAGLIIRNLENRREMMAGIKKTPLLTPDEIEEELVKILHKNFIDFYHQLRQNESSTGVIKEDQFRALVNQTIGYTTSDDQWNNLKPYLVYAEPGMIYWDHFLNLFSRPTNVSRHLTTEIFDASKTHCPPIADDSRGDIRDKVTLLRLVEHIVRTKLHHIDKSYKHYDQPEINMLSKEDFGELLNSHGLLLTLAELDYLWSLLDAIEPNREYHNYRQVMSFFYNRTRSLVAEMLRLRRHAKTLDIHDPNVEALRKWRAELKQLKSKDDADQLKAGKIASSLPPRTARFNRPSTEQLDQICSKISKCVQRNWDALQRCLIDRDGSGATKLLWSDFKYILRQFGFPLSESELDQLCAGFASREKDYVSYPKFMDYFSRSLPKEQVSQTSFDERTYQFTNQKNGEKMGFAQILGEIRKACTSQWRTLQEAFNKFDSERQGLLSIKQIDTILRKRGIELSPDDLYHLLTSFDSKMNGLIDFRDFKRATLKAYKPVA